MVSKKFYKKSKKKSFFFFFTFLYLGKTDIVLGRKVVIFDWELAEIWILEMGRKPPEYILVEPSCSGNTFSNHVTIEARILRE